MAKSATSLINLRYQHGGEGSPSNPAKFKDQDFAELKADCLHRKQLFVDMEFPPNSRSLGDVPGVKHVKWLRPEVLLKNKDTPAFIVDGMSRFDFGQGSVGDCWFVAAISAGTFQKDLMAQVVPMEQSFKNHAGIFHFRFWRFGKWVDVVIDDYLPTSNNQLLFLRSKSGNEFWAPLLEKAYAKICGSYAEMIGGFPSEACKDFIGGVNQMYKLRDDNSPQLIWQTLEKATACNSLTCCWTPSNEGVVVSDNGLLKKHAYSVTGVTEVEFNGSKVKLVRIMNPHGKREWNGEWSDKSDLWSKVRPEDLEKRFDRDEGEFWMRLEDFCRHFSKVSISYETPNFTDGDFKCQWKCMDYEGSWVANRFALVSEDKFDPSTLASNPQFRIQVSATDKEPKRKSVLLSLIQKPHQGYRKTVVPQGLKIYKVPPGTPQGPLDVPFFQKNKPVQATQVYTDERDQTELHSLEPGEYAIIPFTKEPYITADFVLTVYTKADTNISG